MQKQLIFEAETLTAVVTYQLWGDEIEHRKCFIYVDNEGTKFSLIRGASENDKIFAKQEIHISTLSWIARVRSHGNSADAPSTADIDKLLKFGFVDVATETHISLASTCAALKLKMGDMAGHTVQPNVKSDELQWL